MASPEEQLSSMLSNIPEKTGKTLEEWASIVAATELEKHGEIVKLLKSQFQVTHGFARLIATKVLDDGTPVDLVSQQYHGGKSKLRPIYDQIVQFALTLGDDVKVSPKKSSVSLRRAKQFALIIPASNSRIDLGLALKGMGSSKRLEAFNSMCIHRVRLADEHEFDDTVKGWMMEAYSRSG